MKEKKKKKRESKGDMSVGEVQESGTFKLEPSAEPAKRLDTVLRVHSLAQYSARWTSVSYNPS